MIQIHEMINGIIIIILSFHKYWNDYLVNNILQINYSDSVFVSLKWNKNIKIVDVSKYEIKKEDLDDTLNVADLPAQFLYFYYRDKYKSSKTSESSELFESSTESEWLMCKILLTK